MSRHSTGIGPDLRAQIRGGVDQVALIGGVLATVGSAMLSRWTPAAFAAMCVAVLISTCGLVGARGQARWTPIAYIALLSVANLVSLVAFGVLLGMGSVYILTVTLAFVFLTPVWRWLVVLGITLAPVLVGAGFEFGLLGTGPTFVADDGRAWARIVAAGVPALIGVALIINHVVSYLSVARRDLETALQNERDARRARELVELEIARTTRSDLIVELAAEVGANIGAALEIVSRAADALTAELDDEARLCLADVVAASASAQSTMRSLTVFADTPASDVRCDAAQTARALPQMMHRTIPARITLELAIEGAAWIPLSGTDLVRILGNLVLNARDAIAGVGTIRIAVRRGGGSVSIEVTDDGAGMAEATKAQLFQPFFTTKEVGRGTGLGLATAKVLIERAGGEIRVTSQLGRGTQLTIQFPELPSDAPPGPGPA